MVLWIGESIAEQFPPRRFRQTTGGGVPLRDRITLAGKTTDRILLPVLDNIEFALAGYCLS